MKELAGIIRLPFLLLAPVCVFLAAGLAYSMTEEFDWELIWLILFGAISAHISVNALNEYQDFISGLDFYTKRTPFSGGSGTLPENPHLAPLALRISIIAIVLTIISGLVLIYLRGSELLLPGLSGLLLIVLYTKTLKRVDFIIIMKFIDDRQLNGCIIENGFHITVVNHCNINLFSYRRENRAASRR